MAENVNVFNFRLSEVDMRELVKLDKAESLFFRHDTPYPEELKKHWGR